LNASIDDDHDDGQYNDEQEKDDEYGRVPLSYPFSQFVPEQLLLSPSLEDLAFKPTKC
jgi:hypothetical protein